MTFWEKYLQEIKRIKDLYNFYTERLYKVMRRNAVEKWAKGSEQAVCTHSQPPLHLQAMNVQKDAKSQY